MAHGSIPIETERLILRPWRDSDFEPLAALNADPVVMEYFPAPLSRDESDALALRLKAKIEADGYGWFAVEEKGGAPFIGFVGLNQPSFGAELPCGPCTEIGWRLARSAWGKGYASEAARASLAFGFDVLNLAEIVSFTALQNTRSQAVMQRIGMTRDTDGDFHHPSLTPDHRLSRHVLYRLVRSDWSALKSR